MASSFFPVSTSASAKCKLCKGRGGVCSVLSSTELDAWAGLAQRRSYPAGAALFEQGEPNENVFVLSSGVVAETRIFRDGRQSILNYAFRGDFIGLVPSPDNAGGAFATGPATACRFTRSAFDTFLSRSEPMRGAIVTQALETLARTQNHSVSLGIHSAPERVASFLRDLKTKEANLGDQTDRLKLPMTRQSIGEYLGLTLETVSRAISKLKREKVIEMLSPSEIRIPDMKALSARCASG